MTSSETPEKDFPRLDIRILKTHAERWIKKFSEAPIKRILLYKFDSPFEKEMADSFGKPFKALPHIYAIVFDVDAEDKTINMTIEERMEYDKQKETGERSLESYERLLDATEPNSRSPYKERYRAFIKAGFIEVYKSSPKNIDLYRKEWEFILKFKQTEVNADMLNAGILSTNILNANIRTDEPHVVLWEPKQQAKDKPADSFLLKARQEVQVIYGYIKKNCSGLSKSSSELKYKRALECFQRDKKNFKILTIKDLDDTGIYNTSTKPDREIMGRILEKIVLRKNYISEGSQELFYKTQKLLKKTA